MKKLNIDPKIITPSMLKKGVIVELEHGKVDKRTNVTDNDLMKTVKIALAHLQEFPDYYLELYKMEEKLERKWKNKNKPSIFLK